MATHQSTLPILCKFCTHRRTNIAKYMRKTWEQHSCALAVHASIFDTVARTEDCIDFYPTAAITGDEAWSQT